MIMFIAYPVLYKLCNWNTGINSQKKKKKGEKLIPYKMFLNVRWYMSRHKIFPLAELFPDLITLSQTHRQYMMNQMMTVTEKFGSISKEEVVVSFMTLS